MSENSNAIGVLREKSLHAALKHHYAKTGDRIEAKLDGYTIDILRGKGKRMQLIEIQTRSFASAKRKLLDLTRRYRVVLVHPIAREKIIARYDIDGVLLAQRRSPKRGHLEDVFVELVAFPEMMTRKNFSLEVVLTREEEIQRDDGRGSWRRGGRSIYDRRLIEIVSSTRFESPKDFLRFVPTSLPTQFTNAELAKYLDRSRSLAQKMTYCLQRMGVIERIGKRGQANLFALAN
jgi:predicted AAA+ superfamily ATPase